MDKKHEKYNEPLKGNVPDCISQFTLKCLADNGITTVGQLLDRWEALYRIGLDRSDFKAMLRGYGILGSNISNVADYCATWSYRLQTDRESKQLYQKIGGRYIPVEALSDRRGMSEGIYLVRTSKSTGSVRSIHSLRCMADEVGWFKIAGKPVLDFEQIAKIDYYAEALIDLCLNKSLLGDMSPAQLAEHLAKRMLEVTENARAGYIPKDCVSVKANSNIDPDFLVK